MTASSPVEILSLFRFADVTARYRLDTQRGRVGLDFYPTALEGKLALRPPNSSKEGQPRLGIDPLVHLKIAGDAQTGSFGQGRTMRSAPTIDRFRFLSQEVQEDEPLTTVVTTLSSENGCGIEHRLSWRDGARTVEISSRFINDSPDPVTLEMLSSFSLGGMTPFDAGDGPERLRVHRFRTVWCAEGRLETQTIEQLHLERSATAHGLYSERFGQIGSMPTRGWFPFLALEDTHAGVVWGVQLAWAGSWQLEISRQDDQICLSGGLADREFGHWTKTLAPGESLETPSALLACVHGDLDALCDRLTDAQHRAADMHPASEATLPIIFNEWCTTWGNPTHSRLAQIAARLAGTEVKTLVIDAGWYCGGPDGQSGAHGDWMLRTEAFPDGLRATADMIRSHGLVPGLWFEAETCADGSAGFTMTDHLLKRDGIPITVSDRRFWDLNDPAAVARLTERMTDLLASAGIGYLKIDYNETIGFGCDGAESLGEGLRQQTLGTYRLFEGLRERLPELVIESCASGGHRLEPSMLARSAMSSFSDAHELAEIPIIAAGLHRLMLPRQSQVWAVLRQSDTEQRLVYSLAATFLGRMCLSGDIDLLSETQWRLVRAAQSLYRRAAPTLKYGYSRRTGNLGESWRHPRGWQAVTRLSEDGETALVVAHAFADAPDVFQVLLPAGAWQIRGQLTSGFGASVEGRTLCGAYGGDFSGCVVLLHK